MRRKPSVLLISIVVHAVVLVLLGTAPWWSPVANWPMPRDVQAFAPRLAQLQDTELPAPPHARTAASAPSATAGAAPDAAPVVATAGVSPETASAGPFDGPAGVGVESSGTSTIEGIGVTSAPPPLPAPRVQEPVRPGGRIRPPTKSHDVRPQYPAAARAARVQGIVIIQATIDSAGNVESATILRSIPLLDQAALDAVRQWKFTPTLLNGAAVPVIMTITVNFELSQ